MAEATVFTDGATDSDVAGCGAGAVMFDNSGKIIWTLSEYLGEGSTTFGEMTAIYRAIKRAKEVGVATLKLCPDDSVCIHLIDGTKQSKKAALQSLATKTSAAAKGLTLSTECAQAGSSQNSIADRLANAALKSINPNANAAQSAAPSKSGKSYKPDAPVEGKQLWLKCPFNEKDAVKSLGARWSPDEKKWYVQDTAENRQKFSKWMV
jgi:ribonuclease HI